MNVLVKILVILGSVATIGFGLWHFLVPKVWNWYSYIDPKATELILAVRVINVFFSLSLVLFGIINFLFIYGNHANRYAVLVLLAATSLLWLTRLVFQMIFPQGSYHPGLQYGMLSAFVLITLCYLIPLLIIWFLKDAALIV